MTSLKELFENNKKWAEKLAHDTPDTLKKLAKNQKPRFLWIGCSDSRVPANEIVGLPPGEMFVHRNIANMVPHTDLNSLSVIQYAVEVLNVKHIIVCGHYGCGGIRAAISHQDMGLISNWLNNIKDVYDKNERVFKKIENEEDRLDLLCELNVKEQVKRVCHTNVIQEAWNAGKKITVHGWVYGLKDGVLKDLKVSVSSKDDVRSVYQLEKSE